MLTMTAENDKYMTDLQIQAFIDDALNKKERRHIADAILMNADARRRFNELKRQKERLIAWFNEAGPAKN